MKRRDKVPAKWIAHGYLSAYRRFKEASVKAYGDPQRNRALAEMESEEVFIAVFETLNWLDALIDRPEVVPLVDKDLGEALSFVRGRVHHQWAEAIEFRDDALLPPSALGVRMGPAPPTVVLDWCWKRTDDIPGGKRHGSDRGELEYERLLEGVQTRSALDEIASVAGQVMAGMVGTS